MLFYLLAILLTGDILSGDILLAILFTGDIIDWRYFAWRYIAGDILLAIFLPYTQCPASKKTLANKTKPISRSCKLSSYECASLGTRGSSPAVLPMSETSFRSVQQSLHINVHLLRGERQKFVLQTKQTNKQPICFSDINNRLVTKPCITKPCKVCFPLLVLNHYFNSKLLFLFIEIKSYLQ